MKHPLALFRFCPRCGADRFDIQDEKSKRCAACGFEYYLNPSAATVALIVNEQDELLVVKRAKAPAKGTLDLPGGFADIGETSEEGIVREVLEETGLHVTSVRYLFSESNTYPYSGLLIPTLDQFFFCEVDNTTNLHAHDDAAECLWIPFHKLHPDQFGLDSISRGIKVFLSKHTRNTRHNH